MKKMLVALLVAGAVSFAGLSTARAQSPEAVLVKVPFQFIAGDKVLPAGTYRVREQNGDPSLLLISNVDSSAAAFVNTIGGGEFSENGNTPHLSFRSFDGHYFLAQIAVPGQTARAIPLTKAAAEQTLARLNLMGPEPANPAK